MSFVTCRGLCTWTVVGIYQHFSTNSIRQKWKDDQTYIGYSNFKLCITPKYGQSSDNATTHCFT